MTSLNVNKRCIIFRRILYLIILSNGYCTVQSYITEEVQNPKKHPSYSYEHVESLPNPLGVRILLTSYIYSHLSTKRGSFKISTLLEVINPLQTSNLLVCGSRFDHTKYTTTYVVEETFLVIPK